MKHSFRLFPGLVFAALCWNSVEVRAERQPVVAPRPQIQEITAAKIPSPRTPIAAGLPNLKDAAPSPEPEPVEILAGHSQHGEIFNEGARQAAYLMPGMPSIDFEVTTSNPQARKFIEQGLGQLYGYWYFEAERSFRQAAMLDPDCAMAYWGMAKANSGNSKRAKGFIAEAVKRKQQVTLREALYIDAEDAYFNPKNSKTRTKDYVGALKRITDEYPDDLEAHALHAYALYRARSSLKLKYEDVDAALNRVLAKNPAHPVHHFRIHLWDYKDAGKALNSAALCGQSSPGIAHMWHMPGHIYSKLKRYDDAVWQQEASARVDHAHMMRDRVLPDQIHNFAHNNEWLIRNLTYLGRYRDAVNLAKNMTELPRHPKYNTLTRRNSTYYGRLRLFDVLKQFELWEELIELAHTPYLEATDSQTEQLKRLRYLGIAYAETGQVAKTKPVLAELNKRLTVARKKEEQEKARAAAEVKKKGGKAKTPPKKRGPTLSQQIEKIVAAIEGHAAMYNQDYKAALPLLKKAGEHELLQARAQCLSGDIKPAIARVQKYVSTRQQQVIPQAVLVELLWLTNQEAEARKQFKLLQGMSGSIQFGSPVFSRLSPVAADLGFSPDWRIARKPAKDVGQRPDLDDLGPFRWQPVAAKPWTCPDASGTVHSLDNYHGKPVIVVFYLGFGCLHCAEQIQALSPKIKEFRNAGLEIIAISSEDRELLQTGMKNYDKGEIPFPLVADSSLEVFKQWRVFDDFEQVPLHGTFLVDGDGFIRWQDISYEPFMEIDFLLKESKRLLGQQGPRTPVTAPNPFRKKSVLTAAE